MRASILKKSLPAICTLCALTCLPWSVMRWSPSLSSGAREKTHFDAARMGIGGGVRTAELRELLRFGERRLAGPLAPDLLDGTPTRNLSDPSRLAMKRRSLAQIRRTLKRGSGDRRGDDPPA